MITFHEIKGMMQKMAILSVHITRLNELMPQVVLLSERIDSLNEDLSLQRDRMTTRIKAVETLGEVLKTHVYQNQAIADGSGAPMTDAGDSSTRNKANARQGYNPRQDKSPRAL